MSLALTPPRIIRVSCLALQYYPKPCQGLKAIFDHETSSRMRCIGSDNFRSQW